MSTQRKAWVKLENLRGNAIYVHEFHHKNAGINDWAEIPGAIGVGQTWGPKQFTYETGVGSATDHWYVKFTDGPNTYDNDPDFDCSAESEDQDKTITIYIGGKLTVRLSDGDTCEESWRPS